MTLMTRALMAAAATALAALAAAGAYAEATRVPGQP
jgi:hypothetical protein